MTYRGRSGGLVVESDRKKNITFKFTRLTRILRLYIRSFFFSLGSASPQSPLWTSRPCSHNLTNTHTHTHTLNTTTNKHTNTHTHTQTLTPTHTHTHPHNTHTLLWMASFNAEETLTINH